MIKVIDINRYEEKILKFKGANAKVWKFSVSRKRLVIRFEQITSGEILYIIIAGANKMKGPFEWTDANIQLASVTEAKTGAIFSIVRDNVSDFELVGTGGLAVMCGINAEADTWFDNFDTNYSEL